MCGYLNFLGRKVLSVNIDFAVFEANFVFFFFSNRHCSSLMLIEEHHQHGRRRRVSFK